MAEPRAERNNAHRDKDFREAVVLVTYGTFSFTKIFITVRVVSSARGRPLIPETVPPICSSHCSSVVRSIENVSSVLSDLRGRSGSTGRSSRPQAKIVELKARTCRKDRQVPRGKKRCNSAHVLTPSSSNFLSVFSPMPQILRDRQFFHELRYLFPL